jgi:hypothetical protein
MEVWKHGGIRCGVGQWKSGHAVDVIALPYKTLSSPLLAFSSNYHLLIFMPSFSFTTIINPNVACLQRAFESL